MRNFFRILASCNEFQLEQFLGSITDTESKQLLTLARYPNRSGGDSAAHICARHGNLYGLNRVLRAGANVEVPNSYGKRPLHEAAQGAHVECVELLLNQGVDINALKLADWTPLMLAIAAFPSEKALQPAFVNTVLLLLRMGAKLETRNKDGWTCLHVRRPRTSCTRFHHSKIHNSFYCSWQREFMPQK